MLNAGTPIRFFFSGDEEAAKGRCRDADVMLYQLKNIQQAGGDIQTLQRRLADGTTIKVHTKVNGIDTAEIFVPIVEEKHRYKETRSTYIAPVILCYKELPNSGNGYWIDIPADLFVVMKDFETFEYIYQPIDRDIKGVEISQTHDLIYAVNGETNEAKYLYGTATTSFELGYKSVKITELYSIYCPFYNPETGEQVITTKFISDTQKYVEPPEAEIQFCPQVGSGTVYRTRISNYWVDVFGTKENEKDYTEDGSSVMYFDGIFPFGFTEECPFGVDGLWVQDIAHLYVNGGIIGMLNGCCLNPLVKFEKSNFKSKQDAYIYKLDNVEYNFEATGSAIDACGDYVTSSNAVNMVETGVIVTYAKNNITGKEYRNIIDIYSTTGVTNLKSYASSNTSDISIFDWDGEPVFLLAYKPIASTGNVYEVSGVFNKLSYLMVYKNQIIQSPLRYETIESTGYPHILTDVKGNQVKDSDGNVYYASGLMRLVEVEEITREYIQD